LVTVKARPVKLIRLIGAAISFGAGCSSARDIPSNVSGRAAEIFTDLRVRAIAEAGARGDVRALERLVKEGAPVDSPGRLGLTPAWWAIRNRNLKGFEWLLAHGARPNPDVESMTVMEMAAAYEDSAFLEIALRYKPDLNLVGRFTGKSPLNTAITYVRQRNLELLIGAGADLNQQLGGVPLLEAAFGGRFDYVYMLLKAGADPAITAMESKVSLARAIEVRHIDPDSDAYEWRERVIVFLKTKGIVASKPSGEGARTKPLPPDLR
jgi:ankyrin repeat protein